MSWQQWALGIGAIIVPLVVADVRRSWLATRAMEAQRNRVARMDIPLDCQDCGDPIEGYRRAWNAPTCSACSAIGCPKSFDQAERGDRCGACDCLPPY